MALAQTTDVAAALGRALTADEATRADFLLEEASDLVVGYLRCEQLPFPCPSAVVRATASMVAAVFTRPAALPQDAEQVNAGVYGVRFATGSTSNGPWLTKGIRERLDPYRSGSVVSVPMRSERYGPSA